MSVSLVDHLYKVLAPRVKNSLAELLEIPENQAELTLQALLPLIVARLVSKNEILNSDSVMQLLHANQLINIPQDATLNRQTLLTARDTGSTLLPPLFRVDEDQQTAIAATAAHLGLSQQQSMDVLQALTTLSLREIAALVDASYTSSDQLDGLMRAQKPYLQGRAPDWVFHAAKLTELVGLAPVMQADGQVNQQAAVTDRQAVAQPNDGALAQAAAARQQAETPSRITTNETADPQTQQNMKKRSFLSQSALHLAFALLVGVPLLVLAYQYFNTRNESQVRQNRPASTIDSGMNGGGPVIPQNRGETPTATAVVPSAETHMSGTAVDPSAIGGKATDATSPSDGSSAPSNSKTTLEPAREANPTGRDTTSATVQQEASTTPAPNVADMSAIAPAPTATTTS